MDKEKMQEQTEETVENTEVKEENTAEETVETVEENKEPTMEEKLEEAQKQRIMNPNTVFQTYYRSCKMCEQSLHQFLLTIYADTQNAI